MPNFVSEESYEAYQHLVQILFVNTGTKFVPLRFLLSYNESFISLDLKKREIAALLHLDIFGYLERLGRGCDFMNKVLYIKKKLENFNTVDDDDDCFYFYK